MKTRGVVIDAKGAVGKEQERYLREAALLLRRGGLVAFPTETVYGLGGNALDSQAAERIYRAKGRPSDNPLIAHIASLEQLEPLVSAVPEVARRLAEKYWPGPLTLIFRKSDLVPYSITGGLDTVAVRMPDHPVAAGLITLAGVPVAAPSANLSGRPSPTSARHVWQDMDGRIDLIIDGGEVGIGVESTILDVSGAVPVLLRPGAVTLEMLAELLDEVKMDPAIEAPMEMGIRPKAPGMKYKHYAPKGELTIVELSDSTRKELNDPGSGLSRKVAQQMADQAHNQNLSPEDYYLAWRVNREAERKAKTGAKVGVICTDESIGEYTVPIRHSIGSRQQEESIAHNLYDVLRRFDDLDVEYIYSESFAGTHLGYAIMNRLNKAAGYHVIAV